MTDVDAVLDAAFGAVMETHRSVYPTDPLALIGTVPVKRVTEIRDRTAEGYGSEDMRVRWRIPTHYVHICWAYWRHINLLRDILRGQA